MIINMDNMDIKIQMMDKRNKNLNVQQDNVQKK